jgi:hypothetical protein
MVALSLMMTVVQMRQQGLPYGHELPSEVVAAVGGK